MSPICRQIKILIDKISTINTNNIDVSKTTTLENTSNTDNIYSGINTVKTRTCRSGKIASVNKGEWDKSLSVKDKLEYNKKWINECYRILKDNGTIWISGTMHNIYSIGESLEEENFKILNNITWQKTNPPPNIACKTFTHSTETILWAKKNIKNNKYTFNF